MRFDRARQFVTGMRTELAALAGWWVHEVRKVLADLQQRLAPGRPHRTTILLSDTGGGTVVRRWRDGTEESIPFLRTTQGDLPADRNDFWPVSPTEGGTVHVVLPPTATLVRRVWLPAAVERNLAPVVELELERELPMPRSEIHADWRVGARNRDRTKIEVVIAIVWKREIERLIGTLTQLHLRVATIGVAVSGETAFNFAPLRSRRSAKRLTRAEQMLSAGVAFFVFAYLGVLSAQWMYERTTIAAAISEAREQTYRVEHMQSQLASLRMPIEVLMKEIASPASAEALLDLAAALPQDSWVQTLDMHTLDDGTCVLKLVIITPVATALVNQLARVSHFQKVALQSSSPASFALFRDRAEIEMQWRKPPPEGI